MNIVSTWAKSWIHSTICSASVPEMIIQIFSFCISTRNSAHSSLSINILMLFIDWCNCVIVLRQSVLSSSILLSSHTRRTFWTIWTFMRWLWAMAPFVWIFQFLINKKMCTKNWIYNVHSLRRSLSISPYLLLFHIVVTWWLYFYQQYKYSPWVTNEKLIVEMNTYHEWIFLLSILSSLYDMMCLSIR